MYLYLLKQAKLAVLLQVWWQLPVSFLEGVCSMDGHSRLLCQHAVVGERMAAGEARVPWSK